MTLLPLEPNPGGQLDPSEIIGRDELVADLWRILRKQSVVLTAERRMGKTHIIRKMRAEPAPGFQFVYSDLEQVHTAEEFADLVYRSVRGRIGLAEKLREDGKRVLKHVGAANVKGVGISLDVKSTPWKNLLFKIAAEIEKDNENLFIFFWDELPLMIKDIADNEGDRQAMEVLDSLRALRQTYARIRIVYTGSIGLHHIVSRLRRAGYGNEPTNDMFPMEVPPLDAANAKFLARALLLGGNVMTDHPYPVASAIAKTVDGIPFYIHHVVAAMRNLKKVEVSTVDEVLAKILTAPEDPLDLHHFELRVGTYYEEKDRPVILALLDSIAAAAKPLMLSEVFNLLKARVVTDDLEHARQLLMLLRQDHYLQLNPDGTYQFRFGIIQRWWRTHRELGVLS